LEEEALVAVEDLVVEVPAGGREGLSFLYYFYASCVMYI